VQSLDNCCVRLLALPVPRSWRQQILWDSYWNQCCHRALLKFSVGWLPAGSFGGLQPPESSSEQHRLPVQGQKAAKSIVPGGAQPVALAATHRAMPVLLRLPVKR